MFIKSNNYHRVLFFIGAVAAIGVFLPASSAQSLDREGTLWFPYVEWSIQEEYEGGNPFDLEAFAEFEHRESGERRRTEFFFVGEQTWNLRFTGTRTGEWIFTTASAAPELDGLSGTVMIHPNPDPRARGFVSYDRNRWMWSGSEELFVPQLVMYRDLPYYYNQPDKIERDLETWLNEHGFNGLHTSVLCRWFDFDKTRHDQFDVDDPNPDFRTFEALELLITKTYAAGGMVHLWAWGDEDRRMTPIRWGINGEADRRLQRYIAARLGPLPGWTMGYGFDLWEWTESDDLQGWHSHLHQRMGWPHLLGGRAHKHLLTQIYEHLDYASYEQHRPDYVTYVETIEARPHKPAFSEDRFRVRESQWPEKDYDLDMVRRGLWHSAMAGGVANIWGYLLPNDDEGGSRPFPNRDQIQTYARFFESRFTRDLTRVNHLSDGWALKRPTNMHYLFYKEETDSIRLNLSEMAGPQRAVAVDAQKPYEEIDLGLLKVENQVWQAPYASDWAIAVGSIKTDS